MYIYVIHFCVHRWHITAWLPAISDHNNETLEKNISSPNLQTNPTFMQLSIRVVLVTYVHDVYGIIFSIHRLFGALL